MVRYEGCHTRAYYNILFTIFRVSPTNRANYSASESTAAKNLFRATIHFNKCHKKRSKLFFYEVDLMGQFRLTMPFG